MVRFKSIQRNMWSFYVQIATAWYIGTKITFCLYELKNIIQKNLKPAKSVIKNEHLG